MGTAVIVGLSACERTATEPQLPLIRLRKEVTCVRYNADGEIVATQPPDAQGGCADGFDLKIWM
jgi:hypothetical protein